jgi:predicted regulator of Ras-like GTPase activity (Roadblock/LC7/MglB family)
MLGLFKRLFSQPASVTETPVPVLPKPAAPTPAPAPALRPSPVAGDIIQVPLGDIVARFSGALAPFASVPVTGAFPLPVKTALAQLPSGAVRIRFAQLRQAAPPGTFSNDASLDETMVDLPLPKILAALDPALLARRSGQTQVEVPGEIFGVFGAKVKEPALPAPPAAPGAAPVVPTTPPSPVAPKPVPPAQKPPTSIASPPAAPKIPASAPLPFSTQKPSAPAPVPAPQATAGGALTMRLSALYEFWPEPVRQDIAENHLGDASVALPMNRLESAMKTGRIVFTWGELMQWLDVSTAAVSTLHRATSLELPLKAVAPLFMSQRPVSVAQKNVAVVESIPNLFAVPGKAFVQSAPVPVSAPAAPAAPAAVPAPAPVRVPEPVASAPAAVAAPADALGEIFGQPSKKEWSPQEIAQKINALPGVAASLIALNDGLLVAGDLPPPLKAETMAAFLPQMFGRLAHYSGEIQLGSLTALTLLAGPTPCTIFKTGALYLAVLGKPGETLPDALLQRVAGELAKRNQ